LNKQALAPPATADGGGNEDKASVRWHGMANEERNMKLLPLLFTSECCRH